MPGKWTAWVVIAVIIALCGVSFAADGKITGWRADGTGRYPEATPVTQWGYWPKSPSWGLKYQLSRPKPGDTGRDAKPVVNRQLLEWLTLGPIESKDAAKGIEEELVGGDGALGPSEGDKVGVLAWTRQHWPTHNAFNNMDHDLIHLDAVAKGKPGGVAYAHVWLHAQRAGRVLFFLDQGGAATLWVNGKVVHDHPKAASVAPPTNYVGGAAREEWKGELLMLGESKGAQKVPVDLVKGWNRVLFKADSWLLLHIVETPDVQYEGKNVVWVTRLPNWSNAMPVIVGNQVFVMAEPDFLLCLNKADGTILWQRQTTLVDAASAEDKRRFPQFKELEALNAELKKTEDMAARVPIRRKMFALLQEVDAEDARTNPEYREVYELQAVLKDAKSSEADKAGAAESIKARLAKLSCAREVNPLYQVIEPIERAMKDPATKPADREGMGRKLQEYMASLGPCHKFPLHPNVHIGGIGYSCPTPISDGKRVWILENALGVAACYDLDGNLKWASLLTDMGDPSAFHNNGPVMAEGKLIAMRGSTLRALDAATGKTVWTSTDLRPQVAVDIWHGFGTAANYSSSPCVFRIGSASYVFFNAAVVRVSDGKVFARIHLDLGNFVRGTPFVYGDSIYIAANSGMARIPIPAEAREGMTLTQVANLQWVSGDIDFYASPVIAGDLIYGMRQDGSLWAYDAKTMAKVYVQKLDVDWYQDFDHIGCVASLALGGKNLYAFDNQGNGFVIAPGREFQLIAKNRIDTCVDRLWNYDADEIMNTGAIFDGGRMYLRGEQNLYCIGEK